MVIVFVCLTNSRLFGDDVYFFVLGLTNLGLLWYYYILGGFSSKSQILLKTLGPFASPVLSADVSACSQWLLTGCQDGMARLFNSLSGEMLCSWQLGKPALPADPQTEETRERSQVDTHPATWQLFFLEA